MMQAKFLEDLGAAETAPRRIMRWCAAIGAAAMLAGCGLPAQGPTKANLTTPAEDARYELVKLTPGIADQLNASPLSGFSSRLIKAPRLAGDTRLDVGDRFTVTIFEAAQGGLFTNAEGRTVVPNNIVDPDGSITLPYAGEIMVRGRTPEAVEAEIVAALQGQAIEPQVKVTLTEDANSSVTVNGAAVAPARVPLSLRGDRLADALAATGGSKFASHDTLVSLTRAGRSSKASLYRIYNEPRQNVALRAGDLITLIHHQHSYTILGSVARPEDVLFTEPRITLLEAIGRSAGLSDAAADPTGVFLFRRESAQRLGGHGITAKEWWPTQKRGIPTVYWVDFSEPQAIFMAQSVQLRDDDAIYVATSEAVTLRKVLSIFGLVVNSSRQAQTILQ